MGWIHVAQDMDLTQVLVKKIVNLWVPEKAGNFLTS
jgi:hypothetical protein